MCPLAFVGMGLDDERGLTLQALRVLEEAEVVFLEPYTSPVGEEVVGRLGELLKKDVRVVGREYVEDGRSILQQAEEKRVAMVVAGDPMVATTHSELRTRAVMKGVDTKVLHNASILSALPGETGLHAYSFGRAVTLTRPHPSALNSVYNTVYENLVRGLHTVILLEYDYAGRFFLPPEDALKAMMEAEAEAKLNIFHDDAFVVVASRIGRSDQSLTGGRLGGLMKKSYGPAPHVLLVPGRLHFTEEEALRALLGLEKDVIRDNSRRVMRRAAAMVPVYAEKAKRALSRVQQTCDEGERLKFQDLFENIECYLSDAERFLREGREELAVLSVGYAEGLLDALRLTNMKEVEW